MKKFLLLLFLITPLLAIAIKKPKITSGINSYGYFKLLEGSDSLYPSTLKDNIFFSIYEAFCPLFQLRDKIEVFYSNYNKYSDDLENLLGVIFKNTLYLYIKPQKNNQIQIITKPMLYYQYGETYFKLMNKAQYKFSMKYFTFKTCYSHQFCLKPDELFYHNIFFAFYWNHPKTKFVKFKTSTTVYLQHYIDKNEDIVSPLKSVKFSFEVAIDFNKIDFEDVFDKKEDEDNFFVY